MNIEKVESLSEEEWEQINKIMSAEHSIKPTDLFLVSRIDSQIYGYLKRDELGHIHALFIDSNYRKKGIGQGLLSDCINISKSESINELSAGVKNDNEPALGLFQKNGFSERKTGNNHIMFTKRFG